MFSITPATGMFTFSLRNISTPRTTSGDRHLLGRRDDHRGVDFQFAYNREVYVARSGGQVREQEIERSPLGLVDHLLEGADRHGARATKGRRSV